MGNAAFTCLRPTPRSAKVKIILWGGATRVLPGRRRHPAGDLMVEFPDMLVCRASSFFIGHPVPALSIGDDLLPGETYLVVPADRLAPDRNLSAASIAALSSGPKRKPISFGEDPFEYVKTSNGDSVIKISPAFLARILQQAAGAGEGEEGGVDGGGGGEGGFVLCSTPELRKHYEQLVGSKVQPWSPKLETISERKSRLPEAIGRLSPVRLFGAVKIS